MDMDEVIAEIAPVSVDSLSGLFPGTPSAVVISPVEIVSVYLLSENFAMAFSFVCGPEVAAAMLDSLAGSPIQVVSEADLVYADSLRHHHNLACFPTQVGGFVIFTFAGKSPMTQYALNPSLYNKSPEDVIAAWEAAWEELGYADGNK